MRVPIFYGWIKGGKIKLDNPARFTPFLQSLEGKRIELVLREKRDLRSVDQNAYYFGVVIRMISETTGFSEEETHEELKKRFNGGKSTTGMKTQEFEGYLAEIKRWAAEFLDLPIPDPHMVDH